MTERLEELLNVAASQVRPRVGDPVRQVLRRAEHHRRRQLAGVLASVVTVTALVAATGILEPDRGGPRRDLAPAATASPERPEVVDRVVRAGGLTLPVPDGWQVVASKFAGPNPDTTTYCVTAPKSVLVNITAIPDGAGKPCSQWKPIIEVHRWQPSVGLDTYEHLLLPGGQPAWVTDRGGSGSQAHLTMRVPWSNVSISIAAAESELSDIVASITTTIPTPSRLVLPEDPRSAHLVVTDGPIDWRKAASGRPLPPLDRKHASQLANRLTSLADLLPPEETSCPGQADPGMAATVTFQSSGSDPMAVVSINVRGDCAELISSRGGRVRASADLVNELVSQ